MSRLAGIAIALGAYLVWAAYRGDIRRSNFSGEPLISRTAYVVPGIILVLAGIGVIVGARYLIRSQKQ